MYPPDEHEQGRSGGQFLLNVDLEVESLDGLDALVQAFEPDAYSLERPTGRASFELNSEIEPHDAEPIILEFVRLVNNLPPQTRETWDRASKRVFDIGLQSARRPFQETYRLAPETLQAIAAIGAELAVTIYALDPVEEARDAG